MYRLGTVVGIKTFEINLSVLPIMSNRPLWGFIESHRAWYVRWSAGHNSRISPNKIRRHLPASVVLQVSGADRHSLQFDNQLINA